MAEVVIAGGGPDGLMLACELGLAGIRPVVLDPMPGPNPQPRVNRIVGQGVRILDHRGLYSALTGTQDPPKPAPRSMFAGFPLDLTSVPDSQLTRVVAVTGELGIGTSALVRSLEPEVRMRGGSLVVASSRSPASAPSASRR